VGFKHVTAAMEQIGAVLGGESSGGLTVRGWLLGKDGIFACALVVEMLARTGKSISELLEDIYAITGRMYMAEVSMAATPEMRVAVPRKLTAEALAAAGREASDSGRQSLRPDIERVSNLDGIKIYFTDGSWALARFSGTEPLLRIVAEAETKAQAQETLDWLETIVLG
jgi:phosphomannomutase